jgi:ubiquinone/menaquinone biosynthesis C-methylase UbiE
MSKVKEYYDEKASSYDLEQRLLYFKVYDFITWKYTSPYVPKHPSARVLDAAGGTGKWSIPIAHEGPRVVLVDLSDGMLGIARRKIDEERLGERIQLCRGDITSLDFEDGTFDMVFCDHALCFIKDQEAAVKEMVRVLKKGSPIAISAQNRYPLSLSIVSQDLDAATRILFGQEHFMMRGRIPVHTLFPDDFYALLESSGVRIEKMIGKGIVLTPMVLPMEKVWIDNYDQVLLNKLIDTESHLCERKDSLALAGHIQAIGYKR